ncbi:translation initiation factor eIF5B [Starmerella bacillaris]|uniref:Eukaryotic translation initiation factor 5B n=1 Tax=Starmerella bacillaris TaxID=1247836 RepID=A0AAV5RNV8_STABA|nr:translation initiation factor eIF5B [Starmerella bacillaris]
MGKKSKSKAGGDFWDEDPELQEQVESNDFSEEEEDFNPQAPQEADMDEEWGDGGLLGALKKSKKKKDKKTEEEALEKQAAKEANVIQVKSKKEKEKEKKEREKAKKKAQAARKAASPANAKPVAEPVAESKEAEAAPSEPAPAAEETKSTKSKDKKKGKKPNAAILAIQKAQAQKQAQEEAKRKAEEEAQRLAEEEERLAEEEEERLEEERRLKREKKKLKEEELKRQGKFLTKKQKEQQALLARRREQLLASGVTVAGLLNKNKEAGDKQAQVKPKKPAQPKPEAEKVEKVEKVEKPVEKEETPEATVDEKAEDKKEKEEAKEDEEDDALMSDWEDGLSDDEPKASESSKDSQESKASDKQDSAAESESVSSSSANDSTPKSDIENVIIKPMDKSKRQAVEAKRNMRHAKAVDAASQKDLRSPICAILGHVDTGKTKLLDNMRKTNVQEGEAGGITQQIGATYFPIDMIEKKCETMRAYTDPQFNVPGLLIIDTPGHESFTNLRTRGSSLCNIAILVVDMHHGLEQQTLESIRLLKDGKTPFVVALNKVDRIFGWEPVPNSNIRDALAKQSQSVQAQFNSRLEATKLLFAEQGFNSEVYYKNKNMSKVVSIVPTSAVTGEGVPDLLYLLLELTQTRMSKQLMYLSELEATILEVKVVEGLGTTIDVVLSNGILHEGDRIVLCGSNGPIATTVRALLTPQPARELRIKSAYIRHKEVKAALGVKISAPDLEHAIAGSRLLVVGPDDDEEDLKDDVMDDMSGLLDSVDKSGEGVCVQASTLGSLEALLDFLKQMKIPVMSIGLGPVHKRDVMRCSTMLERKRELALMLCFDVKVDKDAELYANDNGIKIFQADIIYHLFDEFEKYQKEMLEERKKERIHDAVYPAVLQIVQVINKRNPMIIGVDVVEGSLRIGTPLAIVKKDPVTGQKLTYPLGRVQSMEVEHKSRDMVRKGQTNAGVAVRLDSQNMTNMPTFGRHIFETDPIYSLISRKSIDTLKDPAFREDVPREDWLLIKKLKPIFDIK